MDDFSLDLDFLNNLNNDEPKYDYDNSYNCTNNQSDQSTTNIEEISKRIHDVNDLFNQNDYLKNENDVLRKQLLDLRNSAEKVQNIIDSEKQKCEKLQNQNKHLSKKLKECEEKLNIRVKSRELLTTENEKLLKTIEKLEGFTINYILLAHKSFHMKFKGLRTDRIVKCIKEVQDHLRNLPSEKRSKHNLPNILSWNPVEDVSNTLEQVKPTKKGSNTTEVSEHKAAESCDLSKSTYSTNVENCDMLQQKVSLCDRNEAENFQNLCDTFQQSLCDIEPFVEIEKTLKCKKDVGTMFPEEEVVFQKSDIDKILRDMSISFEPLSPIYDLDPIFYKRNKSTNTDFCEVGSNFENIPSNVKQSESRPPSRVGNIKNEQLSDKRGILRLWEMLGETIFALIEQSRFEMRMNEMNLSNQEMENIARIFQQRQSEIPSDNIENYIDPKLFQYDSPNSMTYNEPPSKRNDFSMQRNNLEIRKGPEIRYENINYETASEENVLESNSECLNSLPVNSNTKSIIFKNGYEPSTGTSIACRRNYTSTINKESFSKTKSKSTENLKIVNTKSKSCENKKSQIKDYKESLFKSYYTSSEDPEDENIKIRMCKTTIPQQNQEENFTINVEHKSTEDLRNSIQKSNLCKDKNLKIRCSKEKILKNHQVNNLISISQEKISLSNAIEVTNSKILLDTNLETESEKSVSESSNDEKSLKNDSKKIYRCISEEELFAFDENFERETLKFSERKKLEENSYKIRATENCLYKNTELRDSFEKFTEINEHIPSNRITSDISKTIDFLFGSEPETEHDIFENTEDDIKLQKCLKRKKSLEKENSSFRSEPETEHDTFENSENDIKFRKCFKRKKSLERQLSPKRKKLDKTEQEINIIQKISQNCESVEEIELLDLSPESPKPMENAQVLEPINIPINRTIKSQKPNYIDKLRKEILNLQMPKKQKLNSENIEKLTRFFESYLASQCNQKDLNILYENTKELYEICPKNIYKAIVEVIKPIDETLDFSPEISNGPVLPPTTKKILLYLRKSGVVCLKGMSIYLEDILFCTESHKHGLLMCLNLTHLYIGLLNLKEYFGCPKNLARIFLAKCLYFYTDFAFPMIHQVLLAFPGVLPYNGDQTYDRSDALISTIQCILMNTFYGGSSDPKLRMMKLFNVLTYRYKYESGKPSKVDLIQNLVSKIKAGKTKNVALSFAIFCKRNSNEWNQSQIIQPLLFPLLTEYHTIMFKTDQFDEGIACLLETISLVIKTFKVTTDISQYLNTFAVFLSSAVNRTKIQEAAFCAILRLSRFGYVNCYNLVKHFNPNRTEMNSSTNAAAKTFLSSKKIQAF